MCLSTTYTWYYTSWRSSVVKLSHWIDGGSSDNWRCKIFVFELAQQVQIKVWSWKFLPFLFNSSEREKTRHAERFRKYFSIATIVLFIGFSCKSPSYLLALFNPLLYKISRYVNINILWYRLKKGGSSWF